MLEWYQLHVIFKGPVMVYTHVKWMLNHGAIESCSYFKTRRTKSDIRADWKEKLSLWNDVITKNYEIKK